MCPVCPEEDTSNSCPVKRGEEDEAYDEYKESGHLVVVKHGAGLVVQGSFMGPSTLSCIYCEGKCIVYLDQANLVGAGSGDRYRRISNLLCTGSQVPPTS